MAATLAALLSAVTLWLGPLHKSTFLQLTSASIAEPGLPSPPPPPTPPPPPLAAYATARIVTAPPGATLWVDGLQLRDKSPVTLSRLEADRQHVLVVRCSDRNDAAMVFTLAANEVRPISISLSSTANRGTAKPGRHPAKTGRKAEVGHAGQVAHAGHGVRAGQIAHASEVAHAGHTGRKARRQR